MVKPCNCNGDILASHAADRVSTPGCSRSASQSAGWCNGNILASHAAHPGVRIPAETSRRVSWLGGVVATFSPPTQHTRVRIPAETSRRVSWLGGVVVTFSPPKQHTRVRVPAAASGRPAS